MASDPNPSGKSKVSRDAAARAVDALVKWARNRQPAAAELLPAPRDEPLYLVLTLKKIPHRGRTHSYQIPLPHPLFDAAAVCLLVDDRPKSPLTPAAARDLVSSLSLPVSQVLSLSDLRSDFRPFDARRRLAASHDLFLADRRILPLLPGLLGRNFKKTPVSLDLSRKSWPEQLRRSCASTVLVLRSGTCSGVRVAQASQARDDIIDNVLAAIEGAVGNVPKKWANVRSLHLKAAESLALPIYPALSPIDGLPSREERVEDGKAVETGDEYKGDDDNAGLKKRKIKVKKLEGEGAKRARLRHEKK